MKRNTPLILFIFSVFICHFAPAATVDTVQVYSAVMKKNLKTVVVAPSQYDPGKTYPVVYLLHGHSGNHADWISRAKGFESAADTYNMIIVCPDGGYSSWYWDSPVDAQSQFETYVSKELVAFIDSKYKTIKDRSGRGITGLSMGGHGALYLAFKHQDVFGAAGSMSGGVDIRPFPNNWNMAEKLGKYADQPERWEKNTVINMLHLLTPNALAIMIDCGVDDFFYRVNENLHEQLVYRNIPHDYLVRPGAHNWPYWTNAVQYQMLFMSNFFSKRAAATK